MDSLQAIKDRLPAYAKDVKLNLDAVLFRGSLTPAEALGAALAAAFAAKSPALIEALRSNEAIEAKQAEAALTAASLMAMNNVWYPFVEMALSRSLRPRMLRSRQVRGLQLRVFVQAPAAG